MNRRRWATGTTLVIGLLLVLLVTLQAIERMRPEPTDPEVLKREPSQYLAPSVEEMRRQESRWPRQPSPTKAPAAAPQSHK
jgi:hypothetical protein